MQAMPRTNNNFCSMYLYFSDNMSCNQYAESPAFLLGSADGNDVAASFLCRQRDISDNASVYAKQAIDMQL